LEDRAAAVLHIAAAVVGVLRIVAEVPAALHVAAVAGVPRIVAEVLAALHIAEVAVAHPLPWVVEGEHHIPGGLVAVAHPLPWAVEGERRIPEGPDQAVHLP
jgi:hypothetical protein